MPVPDKTYFGEKPEGGAITYREARTITDDRRKLEILKGRIDTLLIGQVNELAAFDEGGKRKVYSPFPLTILTLLAIETLGHVINDIEKIKEQSEFDQSKTIVTPVYLLIDRKLSNKPTKPFYEGFQRIHGKDDKKSIKKYSDVIHKYQRNTFNHGYQSRGVYLTEDFGEPFKIDEENGCIYLNPYSFWEAFKTTKENVFTDILAGKNKEWRKNASLYFLRLIN